MSHAKKYKYYVDVATNRKLKFEDLPLLVAKALRQPHDAQEPSARKLWDIELELTTDVQHGRLVVCHPETLAAYSPPISEDQLNGSVLIPELDLSDYLGATRGIEVRLKPHGLGPDFWTFENAAADIQKVDTFFGGDGKTFLSYLLEAAKDGDISVYDPDTLTEFKKPIKCIRPNVDFVSSDDVIECFAAEGGMNFAEDETRNWPGVRISDISRPPSLRDKKPWITEEIDARPGLYLYQQAACEIAETQKWDDATFQDFLLDLASAIRGNHLEIYKPRTGITASPETQVKWFVTVDGVNAWLDKKPHITYRWLRQGARPSVASEENPTPMDISQSKVKNRAWRDVALPYIVQTYKSGQFSSAKDLYNALEKKIGTVGSPFEKGVGPHAYTLFVKEISQPLKLKTFQNAWQEIKNSQ